MTLIEIKAQLRVIDDRIRDNDEVHTFIAIRNKLLSIMHKRESESCGK